MSEPKLVPETEEGKPLELDETTRLLNLSRKELVDIITKQDTTAKKTNTRNKNMKDKLDKLQEELDLSVDEIVKLREERDMSHEENARMSGTLITKNRTINEVTETVISLITSINSAVTLSERNLVYNGILKGRE